MSSIESLLSTTLSPGSSNIFRMHIMICMLQAFLCHYVRADVLIPKQFPLVMWLIIIHLCDWETEESVNFADFCCSLCTLARRWNLGQDMTWFLHSTRQVLARHMLVLVHMVTDCRHHQALFLPTTLVTAIHVRTSETFCSKLWLSQTKVLMKLRLGK